MAYHYEVSGAKDLQAALAKTTNDLHSEQSARSLDYHASNQRLKSMRLEADSAKEALKQAKKTVKVKEFELKCAQEMITATDNDKKRLEEQVGKLTKKVEELEVAMQNRPVCDYCAQRQQPQQYYMDPNAYGYEQPNYYPNAQPMAPEYYGNEQYYGAQNNNGNNGQYYGGGN